MSVDSSPSKIRNEQKLGTIAAVLELKVGTYLKKNKE